MRKGYLGVDVGSISTKAVVIAALEPQLAGEDVEVAAVGTTGSARELIGSVLGAQVVKNEITAHAMGTLSLHADVRTIFEIGGQDSKIIVLRDGVPVDYAMNTLCAAGTGSFLSSQSRRLGIPVEEFGDYALRSTRPTKIAGRCTVFAESDLVHKAQIGYAIEDIVAGLCDAIVNNYLNNVGKGKEIEAPVVFQGGVSKNVGVVEAFKRITGHDVIVDDYGHLMGALGIALLAQNRGAEERFDFGVRDLTFETMGDECGGCPNNCEVVYVLRDGEFIDGWGNRCATGIERVRRAAEGA